MNAADFKGKDSSRLPGKEIIIVIVVIFTSLSFTLGFFVGRSNREKSPAPVVQAADQSPAPLQGPDPGQAAKSVETAPPGGQYALQPADDMPSSQPGPAPVTAGKFPPPPDSPKETVNSVRNTSGSLNPVGEQRDIGSGVVKGTSKDHAKVTGKEPAAPARSKASKSDIIYTVQLGALKNEADADTFRTKLEKKGYKTYMLVSKNKKREKIFKVRTGEFRQRKDAEVLSLKLKKTEGLNTFVTFKNE